MLVEQPAPNEPSLEEIAANLLVGDCKTIERFATDIRPAVEKELGPLDELNVPAVADAA